MWPCINKFVWLFPAQCVIRRDDMMMQHRPISYNIKTTRHWSSCYNAMFCWQTFGPGTHLDVTWHTPPTQTPLHQVHPLVTAALHDGSDCSCRKMHPERKKSSLWRHLLWIWTWFDLAMTYEDMEPGPLGELNQSGIGEFGSQVGALSSLSYFYMTHSFAVL